MLREEFKKTVEQYTEKGKTIIYLDESGFSVDCPRTHGYSNKGERCLGKKNWHAKGRTNVIGAIQNNQLLAVRLFDCSVDSNVFYAWLIEALIPELPPESVVVMDNASFHKRNDMEESLKKENHTLLFLPPYSPDLNPIEHKWAQAKAIRKRERCNTEELFSSNLI